jgi:outer membrane protein
MKKNKIGLIIFTAFLIMISSLYAKPPYTEKQSQPDIFNVGAGFVLSTKPYKSADTEIYPIPFIFYKSGRLTFEGKSASYTLVEQEKWSISGITSWRFDGYDNDDSSVFEGMDDRKMSLDSGLQIAVDALSGKITGYWITDTLARHQGSEFQLKYSKNFKSNKFSFTPGAGVSFQSSELSNYYYGVKNSEAAAARPAYKPNSTTIPFICLNVIYKVKDRWNFFGNVKYEFLDDEISDSPIVSEHYTFTLMGGLTYSF